MREALVGAVGEIPGDGLVVVEADNPAAAALRQDVVRDLGRPAVRDDAHRHPVRATARNVAGTDNIPLIGAVADGDAGHLGALDQVAGDARIGLNSDAAAAV